MEITSVQHELRDQNCRTMDYLRISITDQCNMHCLYCRPKSAMSGCIRCKELLTQEEIIKIASIFTKLGIKKIKITGGEPLLREDCVPMIGDLKKLPGIQSVTLTTNGLLLRPQIAKLKDAKVDGINVSLDSLNVATFERINGCQEVHKVLLALFQSMRAGIPTKINCVILPGINEHEIIEFAELARDYPISVRFIERMPFGCNTPPNMICGGEILQELTAYFGEFKKVFKDYGNGPAVYYTRNEFLGRIGFINAISEMFCTSCNRLRLLADGRLQVCLDQEPVLNVAKLLRDQVPETEIINQIKEVVSQKQRNHHFNEMTNSQNMWEIGG